MPFIKDLNSGDVIRFHVVGPVFRYWRLLQNPNDGAPLGAAWSSIRRVNATTVLVQNGTIVPGSEQDNNSWCSLSLDQEADLVPADQIPDCLP